MTVCKLANKYSATVHKSRQYETRSTLWGIKNTPNFFSS